MRVALPNCRGRNNVIIEFRVVVTTDEDTPGESAQYVRSVVDKMCRYLEDAGLSAYFREENNGR